jgi:hypothetical protein
MSILVRTFALIYDAQELKESGVAETQMQRVPSEDPNHSCPEACSADDRLD